MPRSRSRSIVSRYCARISRASTAPVSSSRRSASVDFPWSMWAMMLRQRMRSSDVTIRPLSPIRAGASVLDRFPAVTARVVVVGSANVDLVWHGERLPAPGETVTDGEFVQVLGGKGANQAAAAAALGAEVLFVGCVGADDHGDLVRADLEARGIDCG